MRSSNPALSEKTFQNLGQSLTDADKMTVDGTVNKSLILISAAVLMGLWTWQMSYPDGWSPAALPMIPSWYLPVIGISLVLSLVIIFKKTTAPFLAPAYALLQGASLGAISAIFEARFPGIVMQAVLCTFGTFFALLLAYKSEMIKVTENFKLGVIAATGGIAVVYLIDLVLMFMGMRVPFIHESGPVGIGISLLVTGVAALNLVLDFDFIEKASQQGAPKYMEWYASFSLLITLVWLYMEFLRLLGKTRK